MAFYTSGTMASELNVSERRVRHILYTRKSIKPVQRAGIVWLYDDSAVDAVREAIRDQDAAQVAKVSQ